MKEVLKKLLNVQQELKCNKSQYNSFGKYKYRSCEDILEAVKPICKKNNSLITLSDELQHIGDRYYIKATATFYDNDTSEEIHTTSYAREEEVKKGMDGSQITGTASSYARKYALNGLLQIDDTKDADTDEYENQTNQKATKTQNKAQNSGYNHFSQNDGVINQHQMTNEQAQFIYGLNQHLKDFACKKFAIEKIEDLTYEQAQYIIDSLKAKEKQNANN